MARFLRVNKYEEKMEERDALRQEEEEAAQRKNQNRNVIVLLVSCYCHFMQKRTF